MLAGERVTVITNGYDADLMDGGESGDRFDVDVDADFDMVYTGHMYPQMLRKYICVLDAIKNSGGRVPRLGVYGEPSPESTLLTSTSGYKDHIVYKGGVSYRDSLLIMKRARALLLLLPDDPTYETCVPSKLYPYLVARRPIAALVPDGDAAQLIEDTGTGTVIRPNDPGTMANELLGFLSSVDRYDSGRKVDERISQYSWHILAERLSTVILCTLEA
jgi:glycosyltransferase involved in cell wall biosynthesis